MAGQIIDAEALLDLVKRGRKELRPGLNEWRSDWPRNEQLLNDMHQAGEIALRPPFQRSVSLSQEQTQLLLDLINGARP